MRVKRLWRSYEAAEMAIHVAARINKEGEQMDLLWLGDGKGHTILLSACLQSFALSLAMAMKLSMTAFQGSPLTAIVLAARYKD